MRRLFLLLLISQWPILASALSLFNPGEHCVAYKAKKRLFLVRTIEVVGRNCEVSSQIIPVLGDQYYVEVNIPAATFRSGELERDRDVTKLLSRDKQDSLIFKTKAMNKVQWQELLQKAPFEIDGELQIGGKAYPVKALVSLNKTADDIEVDGLIKTEFKAFEMKPPTLALGIAAKVKEELELHFHLLGSKTLGIDSLF